MITKWKVSNFKSIREETELSFAPLTIFAGANSSGKSTLIQSLLLVAQTLAHKVGSRSVVLNGALTSLGQFDDLKSSGSEFDQITIKCTCRPILGTDVPSPRGAKFPRAIMPTYYYSRHSQLQEIDCEMTFDADSSSAQRDIFQIQPRLFATQLASTYRDEDNIDQKATIAIRHSNKGIYEIDGMDSVGEIDDQIRASLTYEVELDDNSLAEVREDFKSARPIGCELRHFLPQRIIYAINTVQEDANALAHALQNDDLRSIRLRRNIGKDMFLPEKVIAILRNIIGNAIDLDHYETFRDKYKQKDLFGGHSDAISFRDLYHWLRGLPRNEKIKVQQLLSEQDDLAGQIYEAMKDSVDPKRELHAFMPARPPRQINESIWALDNFFASSFKYLGPLRDTPKPLYPLSPAADPHDVGLRGEHTASILELHKNKKIKYIPSDNFTLPNINSKMITRTLETAVIDWLQYLGVASTVQSRDKGKLGHELKVSLSNSDSNHDLTHVGVGVSQVLPILVMCLLADTDSTMIFEQPELHLHPKVQTLLGDFFISMALSNKQCIVETHSEYLIDRLRFRIAAAPFKSEVKHHSKIYFVEKPSQESSFREVVINDYGAISDWPEGFFDQSQQQAEDILRAATRKRKANRRKNDE